MNARSLAAAALVAFLGTALAQPKPADPKAPAAQPKADPKAADAPDLNKLLATRVTLDKGFEAPFKEAVAMLAEKYDLPLVIDPRLGADPGGMAAAGVAACAPADDMPVKLPRLRNVRLDTVLKILVEQVNGKFLVYPDHIKLVPELFAANEAGLLTPHADSINDDAPPLTQIDLLRTRPLIKRALVNATFKNRPLTEVIDEIAEATGANVAVSPLVPANVRQTAVTVRFANTPVDAAVRTLCEMTECGAIEDANVLLVTTRERAAARAKEEAQKTKDRQSPQQLCGGFGLGGLGGLGVPGVGAPPHGPDLAAELAKLKEQNEQLKKDLEEIKKLLKK